LRKGFRLRVLIADDHRLILDATRRALEAAPDVTIVAETMSGAEVLPLVARTHPDIALLDLRMPGVDGFTAIDRIRSRHPGVKIVVLSVTADLDTINAALRHGASAYVLKSVNPEDLPAILRQVIDGTFFSVAEVDSTTAAGAESGLSERELAILRSVAHGLSNEAIAKEHWIARQTVKFHLTNIYRKLGVANRTDATRYAFEHGLVDATAVDA
jgi:DNA-binding NarL/FixJ family response regulator